MRHVNAQCLFGLSCSASLYTVMQRHVSSGCGTADPYLFVIYDEWKKNKAQLHDVIVMIIMTLISLKSNLNHLLLVTDHFVESGDAEYFFCITNRSMPEDFSEPLH